MAAPHEGLPVTTVMMRNKYTPRGVSAGRAGKRKGGPLRGRLQMCMVR